MVRICNGSLRPGNTPGTGTLSREEWERFGRGQMRCPFCRQYVAHDGKGRLVEHSPVRA